jgi:hypothetical protein
MDEDKRLLYYLFFAHLNLDQAGFAAATRTAASQVSACLHGRRTVPDTVLEAAADAVRFPRSLLRPALRAVRSYRAATRGWSRVDPVMTESFFNELLAWSGEALDAIFEAVAPPPPRKRTEPSEMETAALWARLERRTPGQRLAMVEEIEEFQTRALADLVAAKSREIAASNPEEARGLADLAHRIATRALSEGNPVP